MRTCGNGHVWVGGAEGDTSSLLSRFCSCSRRSMPPRSPRPKSSSASCLDGTVAGSQLKMVPVMSCGEVIRVRPADWPADWPLRPPWPQSGLRRSGLSPDGSQRRAGPFDEPPLLLFVNGVEVDRSVLVRVPIEGEAEFLGDLEHLFLLLLDPKIAAHDRSGAHDRAAHSGGSGNPWPWP